MRLLFGSSVLRRQYKIPKALYFKQFVKESSGTGAYRHTVKRLTLEVPLLHPCIVYTILFEHRVINMKDAIKHLAQNTLTEKELVS